MFKVCVFADKIMYVLPATITQHLPVCKDKTEKHVTRTIRLQ